MVHGIPLPSPLSSQDKTEYNRSPNLYQGQSSSGIWEFRLFCSLSFAPHWLSQHMELWIKTS